MTAIDLIRLKIKKLYESNSTIHISISRAHPRQVLEDDPAVIKGVYPHVFRIEERSSGNPQCHIIQYADLLTKQICIRELNEK